MPTAVRWREVRAEVRQVVANYAANLLPPEDPRWSPGTIGYSLTLDTSQALLLGMTAAAAAGTLLLGSGVAVSPGGR